MENKECNKPSFLNADSVQMQNLPTWPPGASFSRFKLSTCQNSCQFWYHHKIGNQLSESYLDDINTGNVPESLGDALILVVDDKGTQLLDVTAVPQLSLASAHAAGGVDPVVKQLGKNTNCVNS